MRRDSLQHADHVHVVFAQDRVPLPVARGVGSILAQHAHGELSPERRARRDAWSLMSV